MRPLKNNTISRFEKSNYLLPDETKELDNETAKNIIISCAFDLQVPISKTEILDICNTNTITCKKLNISISKLLSSSKIKQKNKNIFISCENNLIIFVFNNGKEVFLFNDNLNYKKLEFPNPIIQVFTKSESSMFLDNMGYIWVLKKDLNIEKSKVKSIFTPNLMKYFTLGENECYFIDICSSLYKFNNNFQSFSFEKMKNVKNISCGSDFVFVLCFDFSLWSKGFNSFGQLGLKDYLWRIEFTQVQCNEFIISMSSGLNHSLFLTTSQKIFGCGDNSNGQLGIGENIKKSPKLYQISHLEGITTIACNRTRSFCIDSEGNLFAFGNNISFRPKKIEIPPIQVISNNFSNKTAFLDVNQDIWICNDSLYHQDEELFYKIDKIEILDFENSNNRKLELNFDKIYENRKSYVSFKF